MIRRWGFSWLVLLAVAISPAAALAQGVTLPAPLKDDEAPTPNEPQLIKLSLDPAAEPRPALKYELLPSYIEQMPGNAAPFYYRALLLLAQIPKEHHEKYKFVHNHAKWAHVPLAELPKADMEGWAAAYQGALSQLKIAAYREECDWDLRFQDLKGLEPIMFLLHDFQEMRQLARVLQIKARLEIASGKYDEARETLRLGYKLAQDTARPPILVSGLIGVAIASIMNETLLELMAAADSPNMYWALASMPDPLIDFRPAMRYEMNMPLQMFPFLKDAETANRTPEEWRNIIATSLVQLSQLDGRSGAADKADWKMQLASAALMMKAYPDAKRALIEGGMDRERVEAMPVGQVVAIGASRAYYYSYHEMFKWTLLPYAQAWQRMAQSEEKLKEERMMGHPLSTAEVLPIASLLLPATRGVVGATARLETQLAGLRVIEALRMHAAANDRKLPRSLEEITIVPVPHDPTTGKPFVYRWEGNKATLEVPAPPPQPAMNGKRYEITIAPIRPTKK